VLLKHTDAQRLKSALIISRINDIISVFIRDEKWLQAAPL